MDCQSTVSGCYLVMSLWYAVYIEANYAQQIDMLTRNEKTYGDNAAASKWASYYTGITNHYYKQLELMYACATFDAVYNCAYGLMHELRPRPRITAA